MLKTVTALNEHGFTDVETFESLVRTHESLSAVGPEVSIDEAINRIRVVEKRKETRRLIQIEKARGAKAQNAAKNGAAAANADGDADADGDASMAEESSSAATTANSATKRKADQDDDDDLENGTEAEASHANSDDGKASQDAGADSTYQRGVQEGIAVTKKKARLLQQQTQRNNPSKQQMSFRGHIMRYV